MGHRRQLDDTPMRIYEFGPFPVDPLRRLLLRETNEVRLLAKSLTSDGY
jgi:hypothetical protein